MDHRTQRVRSVNELFIELFIFIKLWLTMHLMIAHIFILPTGYVWNNSSIPVSPEVIISFTVKHFKLQYSDTLTGFSSYNIKPDKTSYSFSYLRIL